MYKAKMEKSEIKESVVIYSIADESGIIIRFISDYDSAEGFANLLNELQVERCHVAEIAEDVFIAVGQ